MKRVLITGASGAIGSATVKKFLKDGCFVIGQYNQGKERMSKLIEEIENSGFGEMFYPVQCDLKSEAQIELMIEKLSKSFKSLDVVVNNAGIGLYKLSTETSSKEWDNLFNVNVKSAFLLTKAFLPAMINKKSGKIVFISSIWGQVGASMESCYSATKGAIISYCKALAKELAPSNINVNCVCPGVIDSKMNDRFSPEEKARLCEDTPLGRMGKAEEVANLIAFLCSDDAQFITGQVITIDGGFTI